MGFLHLLHKKRIAVEQIAQKWLKAGRSLSGYSWHIILLGTLLIVGLWSFIWNQINYDYNRTMAESSKETMNLAIAFEEQVRRIIANADEELLNLKQAFERDGLSSPVFAAYVQTVTKDSSRDIVTVINEQGIVGVSFIQDALELNYLDREYFQFHRNAATTELYIGKPIVGRVSGRSVIPLSRRINKPDGSFGGIVYISLRSDYFLSFYQKIDLGQNQLISLSGMDGFNRARRVGDNWDTGQDIRGSDFWRNAQAGRVYATLQTTNNLDGVTRVSSYRVMPEYPLIVLVGKSTQVVLADYEQRRQSYSLGASVTSLFILVFCILLISRHEKTKKLATAVQQEKERLSSLMNSISDEVWFADIQKQITLTNPSTAWDLHLGSVGLDIEKLGASLKVLRPDGSPRPVEEAPSLRALQGEVVRNEQQIIRAPGNGELRYREVSSTPVRNADGSIIGSVTVLHDITKRKAMEDEIKKHRDNLQILVEEQVREIHKMNVEMTAIFESISDPFYVLDKKWRLAYINKEAAQTADIKLNETHIGRNIWEVLPERVGGELYQKYHEAFANNKPIQAIFKNSIGARLFDTCLYPYANGLLVYLRDVTEKKKYEAELSRLDRLNVIGEMAASIGHEVRNPMTTVRGYLQWFSQKAAFVEYRKSLALMIEELDRANAIITEFLSLAKNKTLKLKPTDLNTVIRSLFPLLQADAFRRGSTIELELGDPPEVLADEKEICQCILNLVSNGLDAMPQGGKITIGTANARNRVVMTVRDRGSGIPFEIKDELWTPFVTTKENGTGLGLPVCYRIAQRHQASIEVETGPKGTTFSLVFKQRN